MIRRLLLGCLSAFIAGPALCQDAVALIADAEWTAYKQRFLHQDGRVLDDANGGVSHSEGQGYGLLLSYLANSPADFEQIWSFTRREMLVRDDGLAAWKWDPGAEPHITDTNNAADGDLLIAYALASAGAAWKRPEYLDAATDIARSLARTSVFEHEGRLLLRPAVSGFGRDDLEDGPVINLSYWIFEAFPVMATLEPATDWSRLASDGQALVEAAAFTERRLPSEWLSVRRTPSPAKDFPAEFSYNALRIPLYLIRNSVEDMNLLKRLRDGMTGPNGGILIVDLRSGSPKQELTDPGYRIIAALANCALDGTSVDSGLLRFEPTVYYPSTLHLLALAHIREEAPQCM